MSECAARIESGVVTTVIVGDAAWARERLGGIWEPCDKPVSIDWTYTVADGFRPPQPYPSWEWDGVAWLAPTPAPDRDAVWDEATLTWTVLDV
jgi:hypothetical protein